MGNVDAELNEVAQPARAESALQSGSRPGPTGSRVESV